MSKSVFARIIVTIKAEDDDINIRFRAVEDEYVEFFNALDEIAASDEYKLISLSATEE